MSDESLKELEKLRSQAVERARVALSALLHERSALALARRGLLGDSVRNEQQLGAARARFACASTVHELRRSAAWTHVRSAAQSEHDARLARLDQRLAGVETQVRACRQALCDAEVERHVVKRTLTRRTLEVGRRTERHLEDEADDAFRARRRG